MPGIIDPTRSVQIDLSKAIPFVPLIPPEMLRDWFAAAVLAGMLGHPDASDRDESAPLYAKTAYIYADAMLKAREKKD